jgi:hypothetical protein
VIKSKTVFVVGAGASCEVGLPVGIKLAQQIAQKLTITEDSGFGRPIFGDQDVGSALSKLGQDEFGKCVQAARIISAGVTYAHSIDDFIDSYPSIPQVSLVGKVVIAQAVIEAERGSKLFVSPDNIYNVISAQSISNSWYPYLIRILASGVKVNDVDRIFENVSFVSFNYDRCIEQFLTYALAARFNMPLERAAKLCELKPVMHPCGCLNTLGLPTQGTGLRYGAETNVDLKAASENLKTYTEQIHPQQHELQRIRSAIAEAHTIIFIGFAFHEQNMKLLRPPPRNQRCQNLCYNF